MTATIRPDFPASPWDVNGSLDPAVFGVWRDAAMHRLDLTREMTRVRRALDTVDRAIRRVESDTLLASVEGKNAEERAANLRLALDANPTYTAFVAEAADYREVIANHEAEIARCMEIARWCRSAIDHDIAQTTARVSA